MEYRAFGRTGLRLSALSFGASSLGGVFREVGEAEAIRTLHLAFELGMNYVDVSPYYGMTKAETVLGKALRGIRREDYILSTKVGRYGAEIKDFDFSPARIYKSIDESLARLGVDHVDILFAHDIEFGDMDQIICETIPALEKIRRLGKCRFIGVTGLPLGVLENVMEAAPIDAILSYCRYALNDTSLENVFPLIDEKKVGLVNASPYSMGLLTSRGAPDWHPAPELVRRKCAEATAFCAEKGTDLSKLALQFCLAEKNIPTTLVGSANPANIEKNIRWMNESLDEELLAEVQAILAPIKNITWPSGRPENADRERSSFVALGRG
ncbi:MAG: aldo/keto reductase [Spirochaetia bacterium]|nr:aldo/keto reductase [Spirochaetia bacterium]